MDSRVVVYKDDAARCTRTVRFLESILSALESSLIIDGILFNGISKPTNAISAGAYLVSQFASLQYELTIVWHSSVNSGYLVFIQCDDYLQCPVRFETHMMSPHLRRMILKIAKGDFRYSKIFRTLQKRNEVQIYRGFSCDEEFSRRFAASSREKWQVASSTLFLIENLYCVMSSQFMLTTVACGWLQLIAGDRLPDLLAMVIMEPLSFTIDSDGNIMMFSDSPGLNIPANVMNSETRNIAMMFVRMGKGSFRQWILASNYNQRFVYSQIIIPETFNAVMWHWRLGILRSICCLLVLLSYSTNTRQSMIVTLYLHIYRIRVQLFDMAMQKRSTVQKRERDMLLLRSYQVGELADFLIRNAHVQAGELDVMVYDMYMQSTPV